MAHVLFYFYRIRCKERWQIIDSWGTNTALRLRSFDSWGTNTSLRLCSLDSWGTNTLLRLRSFDSWGTNTSLHLRSFDSWGTNSSLRLRSFDSWGTNTSLHLRSFDSWWTNTSLHLRSFDSCWTNTLVCLRSFDSLGTKKFVILRPFDSWGTNIFVLIQKIVFVFVLHASVSRWVWESPTLVCTRSSDLGSQQSYPDTTTGITSYQWSARGEVQHGAQLAGPWVLLYFWMVACLMNLIFQSRLNSIFFALLQLNSLDTVYWITSGFWPPVRARALRAPVFLGSLIRQKRCCAPPVHCSFAASYKNKTPISRNKMLPFRPKLGPPGA